MDQAEFFIKSRRVILPTGVAPATVWVKDGKVAGILGPDQSRHPLPLSVSVIDVENDVVMPGLVDTHAHINEPGRTEWEGFKTATRAAAAGGITTVVDMPLNSIPATTRLEALRLKTWEAEGECWIDYGFWGGVVPGNREELQPMVDFGILGFKAFLIDSGVSEFKHVDETHLREAMPILAKAGVPLLVHAELEGKNNPLAEQLDPSTQRSYRTYLDSRPPEWERQAVALMIGLSDEFHCRVHIVHLSSAEALGDLATARRNGVPITVETCPHYLSLTAEEIPDGATHFKCAPPIRGRENQEGLWKGLIDGVIDFIVSDHSPCTPGLKQLEKGDFSSAWGGISSIQFSLPIVWTQMVKRGLSLSRLAQWMCERPARFAGLTQKGSIEVGRDADLVIWDPERKFVLNPQMIRHRHPVTPYSGSEFQGVVKTAFLRGRLIYQNGEFPTVHFGQPLFRRKSC